MPKFATLTGSADKLLLLLTRPSSSTVPSPAEKTGSAFSITPRCPPPGRVSSAPGWPPADFQAVQQESARIPAGTVTGSVLLGRNFLSSLSVQKNGLSGQTAGSGRAGRPSPGDQVPPGSGSFSTIRTVSTLRCTIRRMAATSSSGCPNQSLASLTMPLFLSRVIR